MGLTLSAKQMAQIVRHCELAYPYEGCGILLGRVENGDKTVKEVLPTGNACKAGSRYNRYLIPPEDLLHGELQAEERGLQVLGYFHSHPNHPPRPSVFDREHAWPWYSYLITSVTKGKAVATCAWRLQGRTAFYKEEMRITNGE